MKRQVKDRLSSFSFASNMILGVLWTIMIPISIFTGLKNSIPFLVGVSVYALAVGHLSSALSAKARDEVKNQEPM